jgi:hypothetical protein
MPMSSEGIVQFQIDALVCMLRFLMGRGINTVAQLNEAKARQMLEEPLWKILEVDGKYGGSFISEGVKAIEGRLGKRVSCSSGQWPERLLRKSFGDPPDGLSSFRESPHYKCQLEHVAERSQLVPLLLGQPGNTRQIIETHLRGCVVLKIEHQRLERATELDNDPWSRYRRATPSVGVWSRDEGRWIVEPSVSD